MGRPSDVAAALPHPLWAEPGPDEHPLDFEPLPRSTSTDVVIVGAGYTGLWTALEINRRDPNRSIVVVDAERVGFGASGRNGGWCSGLLPVSLGSLAGAWGRQGAIAVQQAAHAAVTEVGRAAHEFGIDCSFAHEGTFEAITNPAQARRAAALVDERERFGFDDVRWLDRATAHGEIAVPGLLGALRNPNCAAVDPGRLVRGLAAAARARGITIHESTRATSFEDRRVVTEHGVIDAGAVIRATEAYSCELPGMRRDLLPIYSLMIATEPLPASVWEEIGWRTRFTYNDGRRMLIYAQRTADGRIAIGGRGARYRFGSRIRPEFDLVDEVHRALADTVAQLFPAAAGAAITHRWGGPLAAPRDWMPSVGFDAEQGYGWAGGYVGDGVAVANVMGRTLADLVCATPSELTQLPWVGHRSRRWEAEPFRYVGLRSMLWLEQSIDRTEAAHGHSHVRSWFTERFMGH
ncbi:MAG: NAD(P)/FAD-dependent oxidoreductase [Acidimicrobiia bacterium]